VIPCKGKGKGKSWKGKVSSSSSWQGEDEERNRHLRAVSEKLNLTGWRQVIFEETGLTSKTQAKQTGATPDGLAREALKRAEKRAKALGYADLKQRLEHPKTDIEGEQEYAWEHGYMLDGVGGVIAYARENNTTLWQRSNKSDRVTSEKRKQEVQQWLRTGWRKPTENVWRNAAWGAAAASSSKAGPAAPAREGPPRPLIGHVPAANSKNTPSIPVRLTQKQRQEQNIPPPARPARPPRWAPAASRPSILL
jgi:hypothetical protein